jgi:LacI family transcriptional regulator
MPNSGEHKLREKVTLAHIAERCGVSSWTASQAMRGGKGQVSEQTRLRIVAAARDLGYDPMRNQAARRMALQRNGSRVRNHCIGIVMQRRAAHTVYTGRLLEGITDVICEQSYGLHLIVPGRIHHDPLPRICTTGEIDGLIFCYTSGWCNSLTERLREEPSFGDRPIVGLIDPVAGSSSVHADDLQAGYLAASHLLQLGHRHVIHSFDSSQQRKYGLKVSPDNVYANRTRGIGQAYAEFGLDADEYAHMVDVPRDDEEVEEKGPPFIQMLRDHPEITAIIAPNDYVAVRLWSLLRKAGFRIPEDISMVGFDDTDPMMTEEGVGILTTVRLPLHQIGQEGARLMLRYINEEAYSIQNTVLPVELIVRNSTALPRDVDHGTRDLTYA